MPPPTPEERVLLDEAPKGTLVLMLVIAALLFAGWAGFYLFFLGLERWLVHWSGK